MSDFEEVKKLLTSQWRSTRTKNDVNRRRVIDVVNMLERDITHRMDIRITLRVTRLLRITACGLSGLLVVARVCGFSPPHGIAPDLIWLDPHNVMKPKYGDKIELTRTRQIRIHSFTKLKLKTSLKICMMIKLIMICLNMMSIINIMMKLIRKYWVSLRMKTLNLLYQSL